MLDEQRVKELKAFSKRLEICFEDYELLDKALTHASTAAEASEVMYNYESLEFLGDAALGLAVAHYLFKEVPDRTPGEYSRTRAGLVNKQCLARVAQAIDIVPLIRLGKGEENAGGRKRIALLADCLEALIGALYLDSGWKATQEFVQRVFGEEFEREHTSERVWDFKSRLQNFCQANYLGLPVFEVVTEEGPDHKKEFEIEVIVRGEPAGRGMGSTKKEAEQKAAKEALEHEGIHLG